MGASRVGIISNLKIVGILGALGIIQYAFQSDAFGQLPTEGAHLARKVLGALGITTGVIWLYKNRNKKA